MDYSIIKAAFTDYVGFRQNDDPNGTQLQALTAASSGLYVNDVHPLLTFANLLATAERYEQFTGATQNDTNTRFTAWITREFEAGVVDAVRLWVNQKSKFRRAKNLLATPELFNETPSINVKEAAGTKAVGLEIQLSKSRYIKGKIEAVGLLFDAADTIPLKIFKGTQAAAVAAKSAAYAAGNTLQWVNFDSDVILSGDGAYYLVYDQSAITAQAINGAYSYNYYQQGLKSFPAGRYFSVKGFEAESDLTGIWDVSKNSYTISTNYGLSLRLSVYCDFAEFIVEQKDKFTDLVLKSVAARLLRAMAYNPNANVSRYNLNVNRSEVLYEIDGDGRGKVGLAKDIEGALNTVTFDYSGIDKHCLPCTQKRGVKYGTV